MEKLIMSNEEIIEIQTAGEGRFNSGCNGVIRIWTPLDRKVEFIVYEDHTLAYVNSMMGFPAIYPVEEVDFDGPAEALMMDLDGTSVRSEHFWMWIIEQTISELMRSPKFSLEARDEPFVSGHSVSEHLIHCIDKYCPGSSLNEARRIYDNVTARELEAVMRGEGNARAFTPSPGLKEFLCEVKARNIKIGLVTSGLYQKAWPEILSAFRVMDMGDPLDFYDSIITAGTAVRKGQSGTLGELEAKPHPWLYAETAAIGLGIGKDRRCKVIGIEDSSAGVVSGRLAGMPVIGIEGGNIRQGGTTVLCSGIFEGLLETLDHLLGRA
jgi:beta-phosphoglucomutase